MIRLNRHLISSKQIDSSSIWHSIWHNWENRSQLQNWGYLATKLIEKHNEELDVKVALYDDDINRRDGVDFAGLDIEEYVTDDTQKVVWVIHIPKYCCPVNMCKSL